MYGLRLLLLSFVLMFVPMMPAKAADQDIKTVMNQVFDAIAYLLPFSLQGKQDITDSDRALIEEKLSVLSDASEVLAGHSNSQVPEFSLISESLQRALGRVSESFVNEWYEDTYYTLSDMAQNCVACHTRLPDQTDFLLGQKLTARMNLDELYPQEVAQLYVATRQFESALKAYENIILDVNVDPRDLDWDGVLGEYLEVGIMVKRDLQRIRETLRSFLMRDDLPLYMRHHVGAWLSSMDQLEPSLNEPPSLDAAKEIFEQANGLSLAPSGRGRAVHDLVAAGILRRLLEANSNLGPEKTAEIYYLLGVITLRTLEPRPSVPEMEYLFEASIRAAPSSKFARDAYLLLEEHSFSLYMEYGDQQVPDPDNKIRELRELIE